MISILFFKCIVNHLNRKQLQTQSINSIIDHDKAHQLFLRLNSVTYISNLFLTFVIATPHPLLRHIQPKM
jgi:hypothetical protein